MRPSFSARLINDPLEDPGLFIRFNFKNRAILFDLGDLHRLSSRDLLKVSHAFISHTHMDHFIGFDHLLRLMLGREKRLHLFGPEGIINNIKGKLSGYTWNLVDRYENTFQLRVSEVRANEIITREAGSRDQFLLGPSNVCSDFNGTLLREPGFSISTAILDHQIPCLCFRLDERYHININKDALRRHNLETGSWLNQFKQLIYANKNPNLIIDVPSKDKKQIKQYELGQLIDEIAIITSGQKLTYVVDTSGNRENVDRIIEFARRSDHLYIEGAFLHKDKDIAGHKSHLTAKQAGMIAKEAEAKAFTIFHFSPRYTEKTRLLEQEANDAYAGNQS